MTGFEAYDFWLISSNPFLRELAYHWAPIHYQDVNKKSESEWGLADYITRMDRNRKWDLSLNWDIKKYPLDSWVYYSIVSTLSHYYITYAFYHPIDYARGKRNNDLEGSLFIIKRHGSKWGQLEAMITVWHTDFLAYFPTNSHLTEGCKKEEQGVRWIQGARVVEHNGSFNVEELGYDWFNHAEGRVMTSQECEGHGFSLYPTSIRKGDDAVVYVPSKKIAGVPGIVPDGVHLLVPYRLIDIFEINGLWDNRRNSKVFSPPDYLGMVGGHGNPPWGWDDADDGNLCLKGAWTHDPVLLAQFYFKLKDSSIKSWQYFDREYIRNPYRKDMNILIHKNAKELYSNPSMSLKYWIDYYGGTC